MGCRLWGRTGLDTTDATAAAAVYACLGLLVDCRVLEDKDFFILPFSPSLTYNWYSDHFE